MKLVAKINRKYYKYVTVDTSFVRPNLSNYGTMGGNSFACTCSSVYSSSYGWKAVDGNSGTNWETAMYVHNGTLTIYNPDALKVSQVTLTSTGGYRPSNWSLQGSNDNSNWITLGTYSGYADNAVLNVNTSDYYKYLRINAPGTASNYSVRIYEFLITAVYQTVSIQESTEDDYDFYEDVSTISAVVNNNKLYAFDR